MPSESGELPPLPPRAFFGRDDLIERILRFAEHLTPVALIGAGGIGKTSIALTILHDDRMKQRFGDNRWFIRCDGFPASSTHFLRRLSEVTGAGVENPEDLTPLRRHLSSKEMVIVLDNAESVLDLHGSSEQGIYTILDELTRFNNIFLCVTSRISTLPPDIETIEIPTLSTDAARETFYRIYKRDERSESINNILEQLDFHPLSITLLATAAQHNKWDANRLAREWERERTGALRAKNSRSLAATIELSLASPMFLELGPDARELLGVVAFFPQGVNENNIDWLFPSIPNSSDMFDKFCVLSLTHRANGIITMLAPLRDYLRPKDPNSCPLLCATKDHYFARLLPYISPDGPRFEDSRWITSEDANVEHLLDVFTSVDPNSEEVWDACVKFMTHLYWHKRRPIMLGPKIEALPDGHPSKPRCLRYLSWLSGSVGKFVESKRILTQALKLWRERGDDHRVALTLSDLSDVNRRIGCFEEGVQQAREASEMFGQVGDTVEQAKCLIDLAWLLCEDKQLDAAEGAASRAVDLLPKEGQQLAVCDCHRVLGSIYDAKGDAEMAIHHLGVALKIATSLNTSYDLFWLHFALAELFSGQGKFDDTLSHIERAKSHAVDDTYHLARASLLHAQLLAKERGFEEAKSEALDVVGAFEKLGATTDAECARNFLRRIETEQSEKWYVPRGNAFRRMC